GSEPQVNRVALYPLLQATLRVEWTSTSALNDGATTTGESTINLGRPTQPLHPHGSEALTFLRPVQVRDQIHMQFGQMFHAGPMLPGSPPWIRRVTENDDDSDSDDDSANRFAAIDLKKIASFKEKYPSPDPADGSPRSRP